MKTSRRIVRCDHGLAEKRCPLPSCKHYDGGVRAFRVGRPDTLQCKRCKRKVPRKLIEENDGLCCADCESPTGRRGFAPKKACALEAYDKTGTK